MQSSDRETLIVERGDLKPGDRLYQVDQGQAILVQERRHWDCQCTAWHWDCDIGPGGDVWCVKECVKYECTPFPEPGSVAPARA